MPKVILVNPANSTMGYSFITPRWLFVIAQATPRGELGEPVLVDETIARLDPDLIQPGDIVGIGINTGNCLSGYRTLATAKRRGATVIMGGVHPTIFPEEPIEMGADAVITGNGDVIWPKVIQDALDGKLQRRYNGGRVPGEAMLKARWDLLNTSRYLFPSAQGKNVRYLRSTFVPGDARCMCLFEAQNPHLVREVNEAAKIPFTRIVEAKDLTPPGS